MTDPAKMTDDELFEKLDTALCSGLHDVVLQCVIEIENRLRTLRIAAAVKCSCCQPVEPKSISHWGIQP